MQVKATRVGYYGLKRRKVGEEFEIEAPKHFSKKWMDKVRSGVEEVEIVEESKAEEPKAPAPKVEKPKSAAKPKAKAAPKVEKKEEPKVESL